MVAENRKLAQGTLQLLQKLGTGSRSPGGLSGIMPAILEHRSGDEVAREHDQIRPQLVNDLNRPANWRHRKAQIVMEVAQLRNGEAVKGLRQTRQRDLKFFDLQVLALQKTVNAQRGNSHGGGSCIEEFSSGQQIFCAQWRR